MSTAASPQQHSARKQRHTTPPQPSNRRVALSSFLEAIVEKRGVSIAVRMINS
jgi:hypothetical protein